MAPELDQQMSMDRQLFSPQMTVQAMRDSRYRHPANAVAELIDNSIDARASRADVLVQERSEMVNQRQRWRIHQLAVFDNGQGMSEQTLIQALRFGGHHELNGSNKRIGKYGMGLPTSSVSQCRRLDVWTWQQDINHPSHSYIDVDKIQELVQVEIPEPDNEPIPQKWLDMAGTETIDPSQGTLVVWSKPDRITVQAATIFRQVEEEVGRIYRHYINNRTLNIRMASIREGDSTPRVDSEVRPNDPLYLMRNSATPEPWHQDPMFEEYARKEFQVTGKDEQEELVEIVYSIAKREALGRMRGLPGNTDYGKHARKNMGVSIIREDREIITENFFITEGGGGSLPQNRWWGCEVRFSTGCDDLFGLDHNKQMVSSLSRAIRDLNESEEVADLTREELGVDEDDIYQIAGHIRNTVGAMMREIGLRFEQRPPAPGTTQTPKPESVEEQVGILATQATTNLVNSDSTLETDADRVRHTMDPEQKIASVASHLEQMGVEAEDAKLQAERVIRNDIAYKFVPTNMLRAYQIFSVVSPGGVITINLNINHPIYELLRVIEEETNHEQNEDTRKAALAIRAMLLSWARMEDGTQNPERRTELERITDNWGQMVSTILRMRNGGTEESA
jgi:hypothetical protein